ncbi:ABC transporter ATP-binding protein [Kosakonia sp. BYX6]|uniref:ABC-type dipeptide transporter n=1 Tax=Kosakonia calanthes TaxID=3139408 RepID=A0ABZ3B3G1_9ENTR
MVETVLRVDELRVHFATHHGVVAPVRNVSFQVNAGETLGIIGESGCGKSVTAQAVMGLLPVRSSRVEGHVHLGETALHTLSRNARRQLSGRRMAMIFQDPLSSLNPVMSVGEQIDESLRLHTSLNRAQRREKIVQLLTQVGIREPERSANAWPHELSGGMRQRVMIAMAIAVSPSLLIADEPTTALDATIQAQILDLLAELQQQTGMGMMFITHDLSVVARLCQRVVVLYAGQIVEETDVHTLFANPRHPYTRALMAARPSLDRAPKTALPEIPGRVPALDALPIGCAFADRCPLAQPRCRAQPPGLRPVGLPSHQVRCWRADETGVLAS